MKTDAKKCPKCEGKMVQGYLYDYGFARSTVSLWIEGHPEKGLAWRK